MGIFIERFIMQESHLRITWLDEFKMSDCYLVTIKKDITFIIIFLN